MVFYLDIRRYKIAPEVCSAAFVELTVSLDVSVIFALQNFWNLDSQELFVGADWRK